MAEALEEGVGPVDGTMLVDAVEHDGRGITLRCIRVLFKAGERRGEFTVARIDGSDFSLVADAVVPAIGQDPDIGPLQPLIDTDGALLNVDERQATSLERVYAGGDVASMARFVTEAVGMGKRAAHAIDRALRGSDDAVPFAGEPLVEARAINKV